MKLNLGEKNEMREEVPGLQQFLTDYPGMVVKPTRQTNLTLSGTFEFCAKSSTGPNLCDSFRLSIVIPPSFPSDLPKVRELGKKIPSEEGFHVNPDGSLCLGSPLKLMLLLRKRPTLDGFAENCIVPFLYAMARKLESGEKLYMGELSHGATGLIEDYRNIFGLKEKEQIMNALLLLSMKKRIANKRPCPCRCGQRLGRCRLRLRLNGYRGAAPRSWFRQHLKRFG